jgi:hypothetical protein
MFGAHISHSGAQDDHASGPSGTAPGTAPGHATARLTGIRRRYCLHANHYPGEAWLCTSRCRRRARGRSDRPGERAGRRRQGDRGGTDRGGPFVRRPPQRRPPGFRSLEPHQDRGHRRRRPSPPRVAARNARRLASFYGKHVAWLLHRLPRPCSRPASAARSPTTPRRAADCPDLWRVSGTTRPDTSTSRASANCSRSGTPSLSSSAKRTCARTMPGGPLTPDTAEDSPALSQRNRAEVQANLIWATTTVTSLPGQPSRTAVAWASTPPVG